jgi:uncharacterized protein YjiK
MKFKTTLALSVIALASMSASAQSMLDLSRYSVTGTYGLDILGGVGGAISGLEGSAITYARDRIDPATGKLGTLFFVGDEGTGAIEISKTGQTLGNNFFKWAGTASVNHDTEGLTYLGGGVLVVGEERLVDAYKFNYVNGATVTLANSQVSMSNVVVGNNGMEGISYDPRNGTYVTVKQQTPQDILAGALTFNAGVGVSTMANLFNPALMGVTTLSDVQTLSPIDALTGSAAADNLLVLSLGSKKLLEVTRTGVVKSFFDLSTVLPHNAIEGVTVGEDGTIYLVAEQVQDNTALPGEKSFLVVLTAPVPEPETYAMLLAGLGLVGAAARRRKA